MIAVLLSSLSAQASVPWFRQQYVSAGAGVAVVQQADPAQGMLRLDAGLRWSRPVGTEVVATATPHSLGVVPSMTFWFAEGPVQPVMSVGVGAGWVDRLADCGPVNGKVDCGWYLQQQDEKFSKAVGILRVGAGTQFVHEGWILTPAADVQAFVDPNANFDEASMGYQAGFTVSVGRSRTQTTAPDAVLERRRKRQEWREVLVRQRLHMGGDRGVDAWHALLDGYASSLPGSERAFFESKLVYVLETGMYSLREASDVYKIHGDDVRALEPALYARPIDCRAGVAAIQAVVVRSGEYDVARALLSDPMSSSCPVVVRAAARRLAD